MNAACAASIASAVATSGMSFSRARHSIRHLCQRSPSSIDKHICSQKSGSVMRSLAAEKYAARSMSILEKWTWICPADEWYLSALKIDSTR